MIIPQKNNHPVIPSEVEESRDTKTQRSLHGVYPENGRGSQDDKNKARYFKISYQLIKFAIVGLGNTAIDFGVLNFLVQVGHWGVLPANAVSFSLAVTNSYFFSKYWTFQDKKAGGLGQFGGFVAVNLIGLGISTLILKYGLPAAETYWAGLAFGWRYNIVKVVSVFIVWAWNFLTYKFIIFGQHKSSLI
ncbi:MAG: GtrA family protein [Patescibacteria group bacterium]